MIPRALLLLVFLLAWARRGEAAVGATITSACQSCTVLMPITCACIQPNVTTLIGAQGPNGTTGATGPSGAAGVNGPVYTGAWLTSSVYALNQVVLRTTSLYINQYRASNQGADPQLAGTYESMFNPATVYSGTTTSSGTPNEWGLLFRPTVSGSVYGVAFYKLASGTVSYTGNLWNQAGSANLNSVAFSASATGYVYAYFGTPTVVTAGQQYIISVVLPASSTLPYTYLSGGGPYASPSGATDLQVYNYIVNYNVGTAQSAWQAQTNVVYIGVDVQFQAGQSAWTLFMPSSVASLASLQATSTADTSSSTTTTDVIAGMAQTPTLGGTYLVAFSTSLTHAVSGVTVYLALFVNNQEVTHTERRVAFFKSGLDAPVSFTAVQTLVAGQSVDVRWWCATSGARTAHAMTFTLVKLA